MANSEQILIQISGPRVPIEVTIDKRASSAYVRVRFGTVYRTLEHGEGVMLDVDAEGRLLGFEVLLPANAKGIKDAADYYIENDGDSADEFVRGAIHEAAPLLVAAVQ